MKAERKAARQKLKQAVKSEFEKIIENAQLTPTQEKVVRFSIVKDFSVCQIAILLSCGESTVRKHLAKSFDKIAKL